MKALDYRTRAMLILAAAEVQPGDVVACSVEHDADCPALSGGPCQCVPNVSAEVNGKRWSCDPDGFVRAEREN